MPIFILVTFFVFLFRQGIFHQHIAAPLDLMVGAYYPWLDYKWGTIAGVAIKNTMISDVFSYFFLFKHTGVNQLLHGILPVWNSCIFAGTPLLSTYHLTLLHPFNLLFLLPKYYGWNLYIMSSHLFAAIGFYFYSRKYSDIVWARLSGALVFSLSGLLTTWSQFGNAVWAMAAMPYILLATDRYISGSINSLWLLSLATACLALSGNAQLLVYVSVLSVFYFLYSTRNVRNLVWLLISYCLGLSIAAVQLLPTFNFFSISIRSAEAYSAGFNYGLTDFGQLIRLWAADFFGHPATYNHFSTHFYHEYINYLGALTLFLIVPILHKRAVKFWSAVFVVALFLATNNPLSRFIFSQPLPLLTYSYTSRLFFVTSASASVLLVYAMSHLRDIKLRNYFLTLIIILFLHLMSLLIVPPAYRLISIRNSILPLGLITATSFLLIFRKKPQILVFILCFYLLDMGRYYSKYNPFVPVQYSYPHTPVTDFLASQSGLFRIVRGSGVMPPNSWAGVGLESIEGYDPLALLNYNQFFHLAENKLENQKPNRFLELESYNPKFLNALNVQYLLFASTSADIKPLHAQVINDYPQVFQDGHVYIYKNPAANSRAYFVDRVISLPDQPSLVKLVSQPNYDPATTAAIVSPLSFTASHQGYISTPKYTGGRIDLDFDTPTNNFIVISDAYAPGWKAYIDSQPQSVIATNLALKGLFVPQGSHHLTLRYDPPGLSLGVWVSLASIIAVLLLPWVNKLLIRRL